MFRKVVKFSLIALLVLVAGAPFLRAQTVDQVNNSADEAGGNYQPMNLGLCRLQFSGNDAKCLAGPDAKSG